MPRRFGDRRVERQPGDDARERDAHGHVVVDADHVGAQALIDDGRPVRADAAPAAPGFRLKSDMEVFPLSGPGVAPEAMAPRRDGPGWRPMGEI